MDIDEALKEAGLDIRLRKEDAPHCWYGVMELEATTLCCQLEEPTYFTFNCDSQLQAYAVYRTRLVVITAGLFDFLCRLVSRIVASELFSTVGQSSACRIWNPDPLRSQTLPSKLVHDAPFDVQSPPWKDDNERSGLFFYLLLTLFRFVVLHEIGHLYHRHGDRLDGEKVGMDIDSIQPRLLPEEEALNSQARELVADKFAFELLLELQEAELERIAKTQLVAPLAAKLLDTPERRMLFLLDAVYVYFAATDRRPSAASDEAVKMSHPPAAFRTVTIVASAMERLGDDVPRKTALAKALTGDAILAIALDRTLDSDWLSRMQDRSFAEHYMRLYARVGQWTRKSPPAPTVE